jgi:hypothetical protein
MQPAASKPTFKQRFLEKTGGHPDDFIRDVLRLTLPLHARLLLPLARILEQSVLAADYDLISDLAQLTSRREFSDSVGVRRFHPANRGFLRKVIRVRVSIARLHRLVYDVMRPADGRSSAAPFASDEAGRPVSDFSKPANGNR